MVLTNSMTTFLETFSVPSTFSNSAKASSITSSELISSFSNFENMSATRVFSPSLSIDSASSGHAASTYSFVWSSPSSPGCSLIWSSSYSRAVPSTGSIVPSSFSSSPESCLSKSVSWVALFMSMPAPSVPNSVVLIAISTIPESDCLTYAAVLSIVGEG